MITQVRFVRKSTFYHLPFSTVKAERDRKPVTEIPIKSEWQCLPVGQPAEQLSSSCISEHPDAGCTEKLGQLYVHTRSKRKKTSAGFELVPTQQ